MKNIVKKYMEYKEAFVQGFKDGRAEAAQEEKMYRENTERIISNIRFPELPPLDLSAATESLNKALDAMREEREANQALLFRDTASARAHIQRHENKLRIAEMTEVIAGLEARRDRAAEMGMSEIFDGEIATLTKAKEALQRSIEKEEVR